MALDAVVSDDEDDELVEARMNVDDDGDWPEPTEGPREFDLNGPQSTEERHAAPHIVPDEEDRVKETPTADLLRAP
jgi:hypothetical protein